MTPARALRLVPRLALLVALALPAALAAPAQAEPAFLEVPGPGPQPVDADVPAKGVLLDLVEEVLRKMVAVKPGTGAVVEYETAEVTIECRETAQMQRECAGLVCFRDGGHGSLPVSEGDWDQGVYGVGVALDGGQEGRYGPYVGVFASPSGNCGCEGGAGGIEVVWVLP